MSTAPTTSIQRTAPVPPAPHPLPEALASAAHPFAELLKQNRESAAEPHRIDGAPDAPHVASGAPDAKAWRVPTPAVTTTAPPAPAPEHGAAAPTQRTASEASSGDDASASTDEATPSDAARGRPPAAKARQRSAGPPASAATAAAVEGPRSMQDDRRTASKTSADGDASASAWLANTQREASIQARDGATTAGADGAADTRPGRGIEGGRGLPGTDAAAPDARTADARLERGGANGAALAGDGRLPLQADGSTTASPFGIELAHANGSAAQAAGAPVDASVTAPVTSPDFGHAFAVQVSVLATEGVQHAELHLNPAELGPVSVHIALDGQQARVDFGADAAATRHAIEAGLPELASALRDAGFTLAGGGVAAHAGGGDRDARAQDGAPARAAGADARTVDAVAAPRRTVRAGGIDLYA